MKQKNILFSSLLLSIATLSYCEQQLPQTSQPLHKTQPLKIEQPPLHSGSLTVICGSMCSGKSEEIIKQIGRFILAGRDVLVFKPAIDNRKLLNLDKDPLSYIPSRNGSWINCIPVKSVAEIKDIILQSKASIVAIDEVHFFTSEQDEFIQLVRTLVESGKKVILAGLELDFRSEPFGPMPQLLAYADHVMKLTAICTICGDDTFCISQRLIDGQPAHYNDPLIVVGASQYEPRCRKCHVIQKN